MITTTELALPEWAAEGIEQPIRLYRTDGGDYRWYFSPDTGRYYKSVTSVIGAVLPPGPGLIEWFKRHGDNADALRDERAAYGTTMHRACGALLVEGKLDLAHVEQLARHEAAKVAIANPDQWAYELKKDILAFAQALHDYDVTPLAVEMVLASEMGYAGAIDLACTMTVQEKGYYGDEYKSGPRKGQPKESTRDMRVTALWDFKSGRHGFYDAHEAQLHFYRAMWQESFPDIPIERVYNWSPKEWRTSPSYNLKDQTQSKMALKIPAMVELDALSGDTPPAMLRMSGTLVRGKSPEGAYAYETIEDRINQSEQA